MKGLSHAVVGIATGVMLAEILGADPKIIIPMTTIGSLLPDIDEENSMINKIIVPIKTKHKNLVKSVLGGLLIVAGNRLFSSTLIQYLGFIMILSTLSKKVEYRFSLFSGITKREYHRTLFHHPLIGGLIFVLPIGILNINSHYKIAFIVGVMICHYLMDSFTTYGLPFFPFKTSLRMPIHYNSRNIFVESAIVTIYVLTMMVVSYPQLVNLLKKAV